MTQYCIFKRDGTQMTAWMRDPETALRTLGFYMRKYVPGSPYPNGKGVYPDFGFRIVTDRVEYTGKPNFPVPAVVTDVMWNPVHWDLYPWYAHAVTWHEMCECGNWNIVAIVDNNWDRAMDFNYPPYEYVNLRDKTYDGEMFI